jgi:DNA-binding transcriptional LysR family regulator
VELTAAGIAFQRRARQILSLAGAAVEEIHSAANGHSGTLAISFVGSAMYSILPTVLHRMRQAFPDVEFQLHEMTTDQQVPALLDGRTQVAFIRPGILHPLIENRVLLREDLAVALPVSHPLASRESISIAELSGDPFVLFPRQTHRSLGNRVLELCAEAGFSPLVVQEALEMQTALGLVAGGLGITVVPEGVRKISWPGIVLTPMLAPAPTIELSLAHHRDEDSPILPHFLEIVDQVAQGASFTAVQPGG